MDWIIKELVDHIATQDTKLKAMPTEVLLERIADPRDLDGDLMLLELFRRGALYQLIELYPDDKDYLIDQYNEFCLMSKLMNSLVADLPVPSFSSVD
jgi:hypothetical protein